MDYQAEYQKWLTSPVLSAEEHAELEAISDNEGQIKERFFAPLVFGTGGLRGVMAMGINRMNVYVVRQTTQALANLVLREGAAKDGVAVCFDSRINARLYAREAACVLAANGVHVRLFDDPRPTPALSFAVREYGCKAGINITASHNPKEYNGYKCYWSDGAQMPPDHADVVSAERDGIDVLTGAKTIDYDTAVAQGLITIMGEETDKCYLDMVLCQSISRDAVKAVADRFKLVYTPFHGAGHKLVPEALHRLGLKYVICEPDQMILDGSFPTVKSPNPEEKAGFARAIALAGSVGADLIIGTDPDADRAGVVVRDSRGDYVPLTGNQLGVLLLDYIIRLRRETGSLPKNPAALKTIVTTEMARAVADKNSVTLFETFTGFKFLAERITELEKTGSHRYIFAFEESYGYLAGDHARDKDAVVASLLTAEMACWYANRNMTLYDAMEELYRTYGYYGEHTLNLVMPGLAGMEKMQALMERLRNDPPGNISGAYVTALRDYLRGERYDLKSGSIERLELRGSNVLCFELADGTSFLVRPSGTEPKIKVYLLVKGTDHGDVREKLAAYTAYAEELRSL